MLLYLSEKITIDSILFMEIGESMKQPRINKDNKIVLSIREYTILKLVAKGYSDAEIVERSEYSSNAVHNSINKMLVLSRVSNRVALSNHFEKGKFKRGRK